MGNTCYCSFLLIFRSNYSSKNSQYSPQSGGLFVFSSSLSIACQRSQFSYCSQLNSLWANKKLCSIMRGRSLFKDTTDRISKQFSFFKTITSLIQLFKEERIALKSRKFSSRRTTHTNFPWSYFKNWEELNIMDGERTHPRIRKLHGEYIRGICRRLEITLLKKAGIVNRLVLLKWTLILI